MSQHFLHSVPPIRIPEFGRGRPGGWVRAVGNGKISYHRGTEGFVGRLAPNLSAQAGLASGGRDRRADRGFVVARRGQYVSILG